ncbi:hypothetical protein HGA88_01610 [Candidatus Roizmanbacteria bacterium]|nr:hypothetical protein [Candidatus Roizmanbacteria bacterium]
MHAKSTHTNHHRHHTHPPKYHPSTKRHIAPHHKFLLSATITVGIFFFFSVLLILYIFIPSQARVISTITITDTIPTPTTLTTPIPTIFPSPASVTSSTAVLISTPGASLDMSVWKTYENANHTFTMALPPQFFPDDRNSEERGVRLYFSDTNKLDAKQTIDVSAGYEPYAPPFSPNFTCQSDEECYNQLYKTVTSFNLDHAEPRSASISGKLIQGIRVSGDATNPEKLLVQYYYPFLSNGKYFDIRFRFSGYPEEEVKRKEEIISAILSSLHFK